MILTRFAPSPTGLLHVGNVRTALINWLFAKAHGGKFMLRMDDTDLVRSTSAYAEAIQEDLAWLGLTWDVFARQSDRLERYEEIKQKLLADDRLYPCYETQEELEIKRKMQMSRGLPPLYDRAALKLSAEQKAAFEAEGRKPHYRFLLEHEAINWEDLIRDHTHFEGRHLSDPILVREDSSMTYILSSVVDDMDFAITHIIRGEDHVSNTAIQVQIFEALGATLPVFAHLALIKTKDAEISKRTGGFDIRQLRESSIEAMPINSLLAKIGTAQTPEIRKTLEELVAEFDIARFGRAPANYDEAELVRLNHKYISAAPFSDIQPSLEKLGLSDLDENFWLAVRSNINRLSDLCEWWDVCQNPLQPSGEDTEFLAQANQLLPEGSWDENTWGEWTAALKVSTGKSGKNLFMPLRKALTGKEHGPELKTLLPLLGREKVINRLQGKIA